MRQEEERWIDATGAGWASVTRPFKRKHETCRLSLLAAWRLFRETDGKIAIYAVFRTSSRLPCKASCQDAVKASGKTAFMFIQ